MYRVVYSFSCAVASGRCRVDYVTGFGLHVIGVFRLPGNGSASGLERRIKYSG